MRAVGAKPVRMRADEHDRAVALTSHVPQLLANALLVLSERHAAGPAEGPGFESATRTAGGNPAVWSDIFEANADEIARALRELGAELANVALDLEREARGGVALLEAARRIKLASGLAVKVLRMFRSFKRVRGPDGRDASRARRRVQLEPPTRGSERHHQGGRRRVFRRRWRFGWRSRQRRQRGIRLQRAARPARARAVAQLAPPTSSTAAMAPSRTRGTRVRTTRAETAPDDASSDGDGTSTLRPTERRCRAGARFTPCARLCQAQAGV